MNSEQVKNLTNSICNIAMAADALRLTAVDRDQPLLDIIMRNARVLLTAVQNSDDYQATGETAEDRRGAN